MSWNWVQVLFVMKSPQWLVDALKVPQHVILPLLPRVLYDGHDVLWDVRIIQTLLQLCSLLHLPLELGESWELQWLAFPREDTDIGGPRYPLPLFSTFGLSCGCSVLESQLNTNMGLHGSSGPSS